MDKTGTVTEGKPTVTDFFTLNPDARELLQMVAAIERNSEHPLAEAIVEYAKQQGLDIPKVIGFEAIAGNGVEGKVENCLVQVGTRLWMDQQRIDTSALHQYQDAWEIGGKTVVLIAVNYVARGLIGIDDKVKPSSQIVVRDLQRMKIEVVMLTGDNQATAEAIAREVGIKE